MEGRDLLPTFAEGRCLSASTPRAVWGGGDAVSWDATLGEGDFRSPSHGSNEWSRGHERLDSSRDKLKACRAKKGCSHVSDGVCNGVKELKFVGCKGWRIGRTENNNVDEVMEDRM